MTHRTAMVVHNDEPTRRLISRALSVFTPAYQVTTADSLSSASQWIDTAPPDLLLLMGDDEHVEESTTWAQHHAVDPSRVILVGADDIPTEFPATARVSEPVHLAALLGAVHQLTDQSPAQ
jgi:CheY-like chemotaxis protein